MYGKVCKTKRMFLTAPVFPAARAMLTLALILGVLGCKRAVPDPATALEEARRAEMAAARQLADHWLEARRAEEDAARQAATEWAERMELVARELAAEEPVQPAPAREVARHQVRRGDTLWDLAEHYLGDPFKWPLLHQANRDLVPDPDLILPAQVLSIPGVAVAVEDPTVPVRTPARPETAFARGVEVRPFQPVPDYTEIRRTRFYVPDLRAGDPQARATAREVVRAELDPLEGVKLVEFKSAPWLASVEDLDVMGRLIGSREVTEARRLAESVHPFDRVFIGYGPKLRPQVGDRVLLVYDRKAPVGWGRVIEPRAEVLVAALEEDVYTAVVTQQYGILESGVLAVALPPLPPGLSTAAEPVADGPAGRVIGFVDDLPLYRPANRVFIDLGAAHGVNVGDEVSISIPERVLAGERLPAETLARALVIRVMERSSTVRLTKVIDPALAVGMPVRVTGRVH